MKVILVFLFIYCSGIIGAETNCPKSDKVVVCYYASWSIYRKDLGHFNTSFIDTSLCTHMIYTFAGLNMDSKIDSIDPEVDFNIGSYKAFLGLKKENPCLKTLLAIGGWNEGSKKYSVMAYDNKSREAFADSVLRYLVAYDFEGFDVDWEYPTERGGIAEDRQNFVELIKLLGSKLKIWNLSLSIAIPISKEIIEQSYDLTALAPHLDYIHLMAYDFTPSTSEITGLSAPLDKIKDSVEYILNDLHIPPEKVVLGVATYARTFTLEDPTENEIGSKTVGPGPAGDYTREPGFLSYYELMGKLETGAYQIYKTTFQTYYAYRNTEWLTFDLEATYVTKVQYAREKKLKGIMVWTIDTDDFHGISGDPKFPVLTIINKALGRI